MKFYPIPVRTSPSLAEDFRIALLELTRWCGDKRKAEAFIDKLRDEQRAKFGVVDGVQVLNMIYSHIEKIKAGN